MAESFELVVFDWDGTLMDSEAKIVASLRKAIEDLELPEREVGALRNVIGLGLAEAVFNLYPGSGADLREQLAERYRYHFLIADTTPSTLFDGAFETLQVLRERGYLLAVATGKGRRGLDRVLAETATAPFFHTTRCADETRSKPHPQMLIEIMEELGVEAEKTLMVGDTEYDLLMASNAGTAAIAVSYGVHERERLLNHSPCGVIESISELGDWLARRSDFSTVNDGESPR